MNAWMEPKFYDFDLLRLLFDKFGLDLYCRYARRLIWLVDTQRLEPTSTTSAQDTDKYRRSVPHG